MDAAGSKTPQGDLVKVQLTLAQEVRGHTAQLLLGSALSRAPLLSLSCAPRCGCATPQGGGPQKEVVKRRSKRESSVGSVGWAAAAAHRTAC
jgi:hypothetical protein